MRNILDEREFYQINDYVYVKQEEEVSVEVTLISNSKCVLREEIGERYDYVEPKYLIINNVEELEDELDEIF